MQKGSPMRADPEPASLTGARITDIRAYVIERPNTAALYRWRKGLPGSGDGTPADRPERHAVLRMDTDAGVTGAIEVARGDAAADLCARRLKSFIGDEVLMTETIWRKTWELDRVEELHIIHLGLIDHLVWDVKSRIAGLPLYQMLGGYRARVEAYASTVTWDTMDEYERHIKLCMDQGYRAFKLHAWGDVAEDTALAKNLRRWTGEAAVLMYDGSAGFDFVDALRYGRVLEGEGFFWYEEPMREFDLGSYTKLTEQLDIPILAAETSDGAHWNAATWVQQGALDMLRTGAVLRGGITGGLKIAHLAEAHGMRAQVHAMGWANAHLAGAVPNNDYYEQIVMSEAQIRDQSGDVLPPVIDGHVTLPDAPGLGFDPDWAALERSAVAIV